MKNRIIVCGSRTWTDGAAVRQLLRRIPTEKYIIVTGGARGADGLAHDIATELGFDTEVYTADWDAYGKGAGYRRNHKMMALTGVSHVFGFRSRGKSNGTDHMLNLAWWKDGIFTRSFGTDFPRRAEERS